MKKEIKLQILKDEERRKYKRKKAYINNNRGHNITERMEDFIFR